VRARDRPKPALTCRQCKFYNRCMESSRLYPCQEFQPRKEDMSPIDWMVIGALIIGIYAGMILSYIALA